MSMQQFNINYDKLNELIANAESQNNNSNKQEYKDLEDGVYLADIANAEIKPSKSSGRPMLVITYKVTADKEGETYYSQNVWDYTTLCGTKDDGFMLWLATKKLNNIYDGWGFSGDFDNDAERIVRDWLPRAKQTEVYLEIKTNKDRKQYKVVGAWDK